MNYTEIRNEFDRVIKHEPLCRSVRKENPGECSCYHKEAVSELTDTMIQVVKGNR